MRYLVYSILVAFLLGGVVWSSRAHPAQVPESSPAAPAEAQAETQSGAEDEGQKKQSEKDYEDEMKTFVPSEKVPADSAISFPVDI